MAATKRARPAKAPAAQRRMTSRRTAPSDIGTAVALGRVPADYAEWLATLKRDIRSAQLRAAAAVNRELVLVYWRIGRDILDRQARAGWGAKIVDRLAHDLRTEFPSMKGFSPRNLKYMRAFAEAWPEPEFVQQAAAQMPWTHVCTVIDKLSTRADRDWYLAAALNHGWSRAILVMQIEARAHERMGQASTNFATSLPPSQSDLARETLKDPYRFDFLGLGSEAQERDVEEGLVTHISRFLLELGAGFAFVGRQVHLEVGGDDFYLDLLFYHLHLRCYVVIELKAGDFHPEHTGKLNFYLSAVDAQVRSPHDNATIGLLLCKAKNRLVVEYALRDTAKPMGVAEYRLVHALPARLESSLPTIAQLEAELDVPHGKPHRARHAPGPRHARYRVGGAALDRATTSSRRRSIRRRPIRQVSIG